MPTFHDQVDKRILPKRLVVIGRIRAGHKVTKGGKTYPERLPHFRLTSKNPVILRAAADRGLGGEVREWEGAPGPGREWELYTTTDTLDVTIPPNGGFRQRYSSWTAMGLEIACDGEVITEAAPAGEKSHFKFKSDEEAQKVVGQPCLCRAHGADYCGSVNTEMKLILYSIPGGGVWIYNTKSEIGGSEMQAMFDFLQAESRQNRYVKAKLRIEPRQKRHGGVTNYNVPVLEVDDLTMVELMSGDIPEALLLDVGRRVPQIEAASADDDDVEQEWVEGVGKGVGGVGVSEVGEVVVVGNSLESKVLEGGKEGAVDQAGEAIGEVDAPDAELSASELLFDAPIESFDHAVPADSTDLIDDEIRAKAAEFIVTNKVKAWLMDAHDTDVISSLDLPAKQWILRELLEYQENAFSFLGTCYKVNRQIEDILEQGNITLGDIRSARRIELDEIPSLPLQQQATILREAQRLSGSGLDKRK